MEQNERTEKLYDPLLKESISGSLSMGYINGSSIVEKGSEINNIDAENSFVEIKENLKGKVIRLNYFDTDSASYKKVLVKKVKTDTK